MIFLSLLENSSKPDEFLLLIELILHTVSVSVTGIFNISGELWGKELCNCFKAWWKYWHALFGDCQPH